MNYHGVTKYLSRWRTRVCFEGRCITLGSFSDPETAAREYDRFVRNYKLDRELNFKEES